MQFIKTELTIKELSQLQRLNHFLFKSGMNLNKNLRNRPVGRAVTSRLWSERSDIQISSGQIVHSIANGSPTLQHFFEWSGRNVLSARSDAAMGRRNS